MKRLKIWYKAVLLNYPYWKVRYKDGRNTHFLYYSEAEGLRDVFNGKIYIDYEEVKIRFNK